MSGDLIKVRIGAPTKLGARWLRPDDEAEVTPDELAALEAAGAVERGPEAMPVSAMTRTDFEAAVAATARGLAETMLDAVVADAVVPIEARAIAAEAQRDILEARVLELQQLLSAAMTAAGQAGAAVDQQHPPGGAAAPVPEDTPPTATAAKTTRKDAAAPKG